MTIGGGEENVVVRSRRLPSAIEPFALRIGLFFFRGRVDPSPVLVVVCARLCGKKEMKRHRVAVLLLLLSSAVLSAMCSGEFVSLSSRFYFL